METIIRIIRSLIDDQLQKDGRNDYVYLAENEFHISEPFVVESTITVYINGTSTVGWTFDSDTNLVTVTASLSVDDEVSIKYHYYKKHSDEGLTGYVEASFTYFVKTGYKKTFKLDSNDEVVSCGSIGPTTEEKYLIALVASILAEPNNVRITTPDFSFSPLDNRSTDEKISMVFRNATRAKGVIDFIDNCCDSTEIDCEWE